MRLGSGPLAGPVISLCIVFFSIKIYNPIKIFIILLDDSKKLSAEKKNLGTSRNLHNLKKQKKIQYCLGMASVQEIDRS